MLAGGERTVAAETRRPDTLLNVRFIPAIHENRIGRSIEELKAKEKTKADHRFMESMIRSKYLFLRNSRDAKAGAAMEPAVRVRGSLKPLFQPDDKCPARWFSNSRFTVASLGAMAPVSFASCPSSVCTKLWLQRGNSDVISSIAAKTFRVGIRRRRRPIQPSDKIPLCIIPLQNPSVLFPATALASTAVLVCHRKIWSHRVRKQFASSARKENAPGPSQDNTALGGVLCWSENRHLVSLFGHRALCG